MLDHLRSFIDVARRGTFSAMTDARTVAVSAVARQVDVPEAELAVRLFHRSSRRLLLTDAGEQFLARRPSSPGSTKRRPRWWTARPSRADHCRLRYLLLSAGATWCPRLSPSCSAIH
jgi:hypothetical protein